MREFPIDEVITCATGKLVARRHIDAVYDLLNYMTGDNLYTHQIPRAMDECRPYILAVCPKINQLDFEFLHGLIRCANEDDEPGSRSAACRVWVKKESTRLNIPDMVALGPIPRDDHDVIDPIDEIRQMKPDAEIIPVIPPQ